MSKQSEAKAKQLYEPNPQALVCGNCKNLNFDMLLPKWMQKHNDDIANGINTFYGKTVYGDENKVQKNLRCGKGGFAVKKTATCAEWGT